jgi:ribonuclease HII
MGKDELIKKDNGDLVIGIDDAGRGCLIGNMVLAGCLIEKSREPEFRKAGAKDSKLLSPKQREEILKIIKEKVVSSVIFMATPTEIDTGFGEGLNLNQVEALLAGNIINNLTAQLNEEQKKNLKIILDCPSINTNGWKMQLMGFVKDKKLEEKIACEHKADFNHVIVSAASILAKVTRDAEIEKIKEQIKVDFGSGYPSDPTTKAFLEKHCMDFKKEGIFRESWATWQTAVKKYHDSKTSKQKGLGEY